MFRLSRFHRVLIALALVSASTPLVRSVPTTDAKGGVSGILAQPENLGFEQ